MKNTYIGIGLYVLAFALPVHAHAEEYLGSTTPETASSTEQLPELLATSSEQIDTVLIDHAIGGSIVSPSNYDPGDKSTGRYIPEGVGIPHALINSLPSGSYYAVVFFEGLIGCPSDNYAINAFVPGSSWGDDVLGPMNLYSRAWSSNAGGCMQKFYIDSNKGGDWLWGALSNSGSAPAIADMEGVPAFAICSDAVSCDTISPTIPEEHKKISNVLFLPGIKGSRLYRSNPLCLIPDLDCDIPLWLPLTDMNAPELFMRADGKSERAVYAKEGDMLSSVFGQDFYASFVRMMDAAQETGTYGAAWEWKPIAYDWRVSLSDIVDTGVVHDGRIAYGEPADIPYIESELRRVASTSATGKATIIAHSNGGLVAKALMQRLGEAATAELVDSVILVASPQSGAPRALGALLYGEGESLPSTGPFQSLIMSAVHAREFALNAPMAYHLLPSAAYIGSHPVMRFDESLLLSKERAAYGDALDTNEELGKYLLAEEGGRTMPEADDVHRANIANAGLLAYAQAAHLALDAWLPPPNVAIYQVGGFGVSTISGIDLYQAATKSGEPTVSYRPLFTDDGDGTVPIKSALMMQASQQVQSVWVDLRLLDKIQYSHANLFEMPYVQETIADILTGTKHAHAASNMRSGEQAGAQLAFYIHSPATLSIVDGDGVSTEVRPDGIVRQDIPGSQGGVFGEVSYVIVPAGTSHTLEVRDSSAPALTLDLQELNGDDITASSTIAEIPMSERSVASLTIEHGLASASALDIDEDGDGVTDFSIVPQLGTTAFPTKPETMPASKPHSTVRASVVRQMAVDPLSSVADMMVSGVPLSVLKIGYRILSHESEVPALVECTSTTNAIPHAPEKQVQSFWSRVLQFLHQILSRFLRWY